MDRRLAAGVRLDGALVRAWADAAVRRLREVAPRIDALNVFPVADADTGQNVTCTLAGGLAAVAASPADDLGAAARLLAAGALREARGSSGVIVSGWFAGLAVGLADETATSEAVRLTGALASAAVGARRAVADPWPGTVLEVAEQVAEQVALRHRGADPHVSLADLLPGPLRTVRTTLAETSAHHPVLRSAGVVDAGACALLVVLEVLAALLAAESPDRAGDWLPQTPQTWSADDRPGPDGAFEVMLDVTVEVDRDRLAATGSAAAVTGLGDEWRTHVHTDDPAGALAVVAPDELRLGLVRAVTGGTAGPVVVTADTGLAAWYAAAGAVVAVPGGTVPGGPGGTVAGGTVVPSRLRTVLGAAECVLATDPELAVAVGALTADPVRAAVACAAADEHADITAALHRVRTAQTDDPDPAAAFAGLLDGSGEVLTVVPRAGLDPSGVRALAATHGLELVLVGPATTGPAWRLGVD